MVFIANYLILFTTTALLSFRLTRSYQLCFTTIVCIYLFIDPSFASSNSDLEKELSAALILCAALYFPLHKIASQLLIKRSAMAHRYPLGFVCIFFAAHIINSIVIHIMPYLGNYTSLTRLDEIQWLAAIISLLCAHEVYHRRSVHRIVIISSSVLVSAVLYSLLLGQPFSANALNGSAAPWAWLILMRATDRKSWISRLLIALAIAIAPLLQLALHPTLSPLAALPIIVAGAVCLGDILRCTNTQSRLITVIPITACIASISALAVQFSF
jgi:hypothetical protein